MARPGPNSAATLIRSSLVWIVARSLGNLDSPTPANFGSDRNLLGVSPDFTRHSLLSVAAVLGPQW